MALELFSEKGYHLTSVQEIAQGCGVSKGAFYKHYDSKESLLIEMVKDSHRTMFEKSYTIQKSDSLTGVDILRKRLEVELQQMQENSSIFLILFKEFPHNEKNVIAELMQEFRTEIVAWHKQSLVEAFGDKASDFLWDLIVICEGMLREYMSLMMFHQVTVPIPDVATMISASLEAIVDSGHTIKPVLTKEQLCIGDTPTKVGLQETLTEHLTRLKKEGEQLSLETVEKDKLMSSIESLAEECNASSPRSFLIEALTDYIKKQDNLKPFVLQVEKTLREM
ncbi:TetR/AcrR family transcriptional regulator [Bacillus suaedae]|uniref:TetR/AcrR family transcriptional regulator n=1 Tax=Halalkalibacter suaedae TaxID=2822140 RepID=UPI003211BE0F